MGLIAIVVQVLSSSLAKREKNRLLKIFSMDLSLKRIIKYKLSYFGKLLKESFLFSTSTTWLLYCNKNYHHIADLVEFIWLYTNMNCDGYI